MIFIKIYRKSNTYNVSFFLNFYQNFKIMKKVLFLLAFVAVYGVSLAMTEATVVTNDEIVQVVDNADKVEKEKEH